MFGFGDSNPFGGGGEGIGDFGNGGFQEVFDFFSSAGEMGFGIVDQFATEAHTYLDEALRASIPYSEFFTEQAMINMNRAFERARGDINLLADQARKDLKHQFGIARSDAREWFDVSQAQTAPYREAGFQAMDMLQDTLGIARPKSGSSAMYHAMENKAKEDALRRQMGIAATATARDLGMNQDDAYKFIQSSTYGSNYPGLMQALKEWSFGATDTNRPNYYNDPYAGYKSPPLRATDTFVRGREGQGEFGDPESTFGTLKGLAGIEDVNLPNAYNNILENSYNRFTGMPNVFNGNLLDFIGDRNNVISNFGLDALPLSSDLMRAINSQSSSQRALANLGARTGYSHITPGRSHVNA